MILFAAGNVIQSIIGNEYDPSLPPKPKDNEPVKVNVSMFILNIRSVDIKDLSFTVDLYIHLKWMDRRLNFPRQVINENFISLKNKWKNQIWTPDVIFKNAIQGDLTTEISKINYFRLYDNKTIWMALRQASNDKTRFR
ncbi:uncharacterized protein B4U79_06635, partial [Dinothrombium tinctorium]|uniref:Neurotransmitter-gated ion-channel ligand-binding domain-containing protein n=1 Tax=Dinothrombium tinctorium TaxID=1965070 RepID=A0A443QKC5_9ACAR